MFCFCVNSLIGLLFLKWLILWKVDMYNLNCLYKICLYCWNILVDILEMVGFEIRRNLIIVDFLYIYNEY